MSRKDAPGDPVDLLVAAASDVGLDGARLRDLFARFIDIARRQAALEVLVLGAVPLSFPAHLLEGNDAGADPLLQGAALAEREHERLGLTPGMNEDLDRIIQNEGVKVIALPYPDDAGLLGAFAFDGAIGPALLVDAAGSRRARAYAMAHEYGHFLADHDPYRTWVCRASGGAAASSGELRAHGFAGALHVPREQLAAYLDAVGAPAGQSIDAELLRQLRVYFEADDRAILGRLLAEGRLHRGDIAGLLVEAGENSTPEVPGDAVPEGLPPGYSDRHVTLAVMAYRAEHFDLAGLARQLETDPATAQQIEAQFLNQETKEHGHRST